MTGATPPGDGRRRAGLVAGGVLVALAAVSSLTRGSGAGTSPSSSYSTGPTGLGAYAELLERFGHDVVRLRGEIDGLDPAATVVVLDAPAVSEAEAGRLARFVSAGGRLVTGGFGAGEWLPAVVAEPPRPAGDGGAGTAVAAGDAPEVDGIGDVRFAGPESFADPGAMEPLLRRRGDGAVLAAAAARGSGRVVALADASALQNRLLGVADNAGFGLTVAGEAGRSVAFAEGPHGYGAGEGLAALPGRWRLALAGLALAAVVWLAARARRFGPPQDEARPLPPPRRAYVDALSGTLLRTGQPFEAAEPVRQRARDLVSARAALPPDADAAAIRAAAVRLGLPADEADAIAGAAAGPGGRGGDAAVLAAGRALARLSSGGPGARAGA